MNELLWPPLLQRALEVSTQAHHSQRRKGSDTPYVEHPFGVALMLSLAGCQNPQLLAAAVLHDVVEDTPVTLRDLEEEFPSAVVELVRSLSEQKQDESGAKIVWSQRKQEHLGRIREAPAEVKLVFLADKTHNLLSLLAGLEADTNFWSVFSAPPERIVWYYQESHAAATRGVDESEPVFAALNALGSELQRHLAQLEAQLPTQSQNG